MGLNGNQPRNMNVIDNIGQFFESPEFLKGLELAALSSFEYRGIESLDIRLNTQLTLGAGERHIVVEHESGTATATQSPDKKYESSQHSEIRISYIVILSQHTGPVVPSQIDVSSHEDFHTNFLISYGNSLIVEDHRPIMGVGIYDQQNNIEILLYQVKEQLTNQQYQIVDENIGHFVESKGFTRDQNILSRSFIKTEEIADIMGSHFNTEVIRYKLQEGIYHPQLPDLEKFAHTLTIKLL